MMMYKIQKKYPAPRRISRWLSTQHTYEELLRIIDGTGRDMQYA